MLDNQVARKGSLMQLPDEPIVEEDVARARSPSWTPMPIDPPPSFTPLKGHIPYTAGRGLDLDSLLAIGAGVCTSGRYQDRLVFPARRRDGRWLYFQGRALWERAQNVGGPDDYRRNLNPRSDDVHASASEVLLGLELVELYGIKHVALVEGPTDWCQIGVGGLASFGKTVSDWQILLMARAGITDVDVMHDPDAWEAPKKKDPRTGLWVTSGKEPPAVVTCNRLAMTFRVRAVRYPDNVDPGNYSVRDNALWRASAQPWGNGDRLARLS